MDKSMSFKNQTTMFIIMPNTIVNKQISPAFISFKPKWKLTNTLQGKNVKPVSHSIIRNLFKI